jgi:aminomethyltransferase
MPRRTPFYSRTSALCESQSWQEWSGYLSANLYELNHTQEYYAVRTACALFDITPLYKYHIRGRDAGRLLNRVVTREVKKLAVGQVMYTPWCDDDGKVIDDGTVAHLDETFFRLTAADPSLAWLEENAIGLDVEIDDVSDGLASVALQGPTSRDVLQALASDDLSRLKYFQIMRTALAGIPVEISRTGYTGDLGYEVWVEPQNAEELWDMLMDAGRGYGIRAAGNLALDMARIEAGLLLIAVDFFSSKKTMFEIQKSTPYELGLGWTVKLDKEHFNGQAALRREFNNGSKWATVGLQVQLPALEKIYREFGMPLQLPYTSWNVPVPVYADGRQVGKATSGAWSPLLKKYIAIARVEPRYALPGTKVAMEVTVEAQRKAAEAVVVKMPFYEPERKKK